MVEHLLEEIKVLKLLVGFGDGVGVVDCADAVAESFSGRCVYLFLTFCMETVIVELIVQSVGTGECGFAVCTA